MQDIDSRGDGRPRPLVMLPLAQFASPGAVVIAGRGAINDGVAAVRRPVRTVDAGAAVYNTIRLEQARRDQLGSRILAVVMLGAFCVAVVALSVVGLHTLVGEIARARRREIAIRLALGATPRALFVAELRGTALLVGLATLASLPALTATPALLGSVFQGIGATVYGAAALSISLLATMSIAAAAGPAWKSSHTGAITAAQ
jgi:ABC-type antimicrobial peptide transport system permease subunit